MAKIKFGMMMTDARGKLGGQVFSKNRAGSYVRTKVTPVNPQTSAQIASRAILASLSSGWNGLSTSAIASWNGAVANWQKTDIFGDLKNPTGKNLYVSLNKNLEQTGQSPVALPPEKIDVELFNLTSATFDISDTTLTMNVTTVPADHVLQLWATPAVSEGVSYVKNKYRVIANIPAGAITATSTYASYVAKFGAPVAGQKIFIKGRYVANTGQVGLPTSLVATVQS